MHHYRPHRKHSQDPVFVAQTDLPRLIHSIPILQACLSVSGGTRASNACSFASKGGLLAECKQYLGRRLGRMSLETAQEVLLHLCPGLSLLVSPLGQFQSGKVADGSDFEFFWRVGPVVYMSDLCQEYVDKRNTSLLPKSPYMMQLVQVYERVRYPVSCSRNFRINQVREVIEEVRGLPDRTMVQAMTSLLLF